MIGLTYRLLRDSEDGPVEKLLVLSTHRRGPAGEAFKRRMARYKDAVFAKDRAAQRWSALQARLASLPPDSDKFLAAQADADGAYGSINTADEQMYQAAEELVRCSLVENYGAEGADALVDFCTEQDLRGCVALIQSGELPKDFFPYPGALPKPSSTLPAASVPDGSCSGTDSGAGTSKAGK